MSDYINAKAAKGSFKESIGNDSEASDERPLEDPSPHAEPGAYLDEINAMGIKELEQRLPQAQHAVEAIESKLEKLMVLRDSAIICAAAMAARLTTLKQAVDTQGKEMFKTAKSKL
ncbi:MAG: hypothetical protein JOZ19_00920 [Rubrobacter sp.]|nr:hypothetical protein [Rubrobacter sp.]